ncbi:MAG: IS21 family transposase [Planctomycetota bacterium]|jgi:transposase
MRRLSQEEVVTIGVLKAKGMPQREIARQLGVTEGAVRYRLRRAADGAEDGRRNKPQRADAVAEVIVRWVEDQASERPINVVELYEHLCDVHGYDGSYRSVLRYVRRRWGRPRVRTYRRVETVPGAQSQTDWGEYPRVDIGDGAEPLSSFTMALSHSRYPAMVWSRWKNLVSWLNCHNEGFRRLGGVPAVNRIDNVRTAIVSGAGPWGVIHPAYRAYARSVGFHIDACQPRQPQEKGKSEAKVKLGRRFGPGRRRYDGLEDLQSETDARVRRWAQRAICPATGQTVWDSWQREQAHLAALPDLMPAPFDVSVVRPVHRDATVHFEGRQYTVPFGYVGRSVEVRGCAREVQIFGDDRLLRQYPRHTAERLLIDASCYDGPPTDRVLPPPPLGRMGRRLEEIRTAPVEQRPVDLYAALAEVAR